MKYNKIVVVFGLILSLISISKAAPIDDPLQFSSIAHTLPQTSGSINVMRIGNTYYDAALIKSLAMQEKLCFVEVENNNTSQIMHSSTCSKLFNKNNIVPVDGIEYINGITKSNKEFVYCGHCLSVKIDTNTSLTVVESILPPICIKVIDGDTIKLDNGETVRLIGVDTPETVHPNKPVEFYGKEAYNFTKMAVEGQSVILEYDQQQKDKYGRTLAYVHLDNGFVLNELIITKGFGYAYTIYPFKYMQKYRQLEEFARTKGVGLWAEQNHLNNYDNDLNQSQSNQSDYNNFSSEQQGQIVYVTPSGRKYHSASCRYAKSATPVSIEQALQRGLAACLVCGP